jgi:hypothetical protein
MENFTMSALTFELPASILHQVQVLAERDGITVDQFLTLAAAEKVSALRTIEYLREEASRGRVEDFKAFLECVPNRPPLPGDEL